MNHYINLKKSCLSVIAISITGLLITPLLVSAAITPSFAPTPTTTGPIVDISSPCYSSSHGNSACGVIGLINQILFYIQILFWILAAIFAFYAAYLYLIANGDENKIGKAHHQLFYTVVATAVALIALGLPVLINNFLSGQ